MDSQTDGSRTPKKGSLKKQLSFDEKVTEIRLQTSDLEALNMKREAEAEEKLRWWIPSHKNRFTCFCKSTSMHGFHYIGDEGMHIAERSVLKILHFKSDLCVLMYFILFRLILPMRHFRVFWIVAFLISLVSALWLIKAVFVKYYDSPVVVTFQPSEMFVGDLPFAAVTICNMNRCFN